MTRSTIKRICLECNREFLAVAHEIKRGGGKVCSRQCYYKYQLRTRPRDEKSWAWKGNNAGREALHDWVKKHRGRPKKCEHCGTTEAKKYEWANRSQEYKRDIDDWIRLCSRCHWKYDYKHHLKKWQQSVIKLGWKVTKIL